MAAAGKFPPIQSILDAVLPYPMGISMMDVIDRPYYYSAKLNLTGKRGGGKLKSPFPKEVLAWMPIRSVVCDPS